MRRLGVSPKIQDILNGNPSITDWFETVGDRLRVYSGASAPAVSEIPENQWLVFYNTSSGLLEVWANIGGVAEQLTTTPTPTYNPDRLLGRGDASGIGIAEEITLGAGLTLTGTVLDTVGGGSGDVVGPASSVNNRVVFFDGVTGKLIKDSGLTLSGSNTGDQTSIVGITGTKAQFDTACTDGNFLYVGDVTQYTDEMAQDAIGAMTTDGTLVYNDAAPSYRRAAITGHVDVAAGSNSSTLGSFTKAQLTAAVSDGDPLYVGDITQYTDEMAQDATGAMVGTSLTYNDAAPSLVRAALTGAITAPADSNTTSLGSFTSAQLRTALTTSTGTGNAVFASDATLGTPLFTSPRVSSGTFFWHQPAPASKAAAATLTNTELLNGMIQYTGAAATLTLPTGTLMDTGVTALVTTPVVDMCFEFNIINTSAATVTLGAGVGFTIVGTATTLTGISSCWRCRRTAANTWVAYRV
jgi:hypothetical protein